MPARKRPRQPRARTVARAAQRASEQLTEAKERWFSLQPSAKSERPKSVTSASLVEPQARATPCPQCEGQLDVLAHEAQTIDGIRLRRVSVVCRRCAHPRQLWFRIVGTSLN